MVATFTLFVLLLFVCVFFFTLFTLFMLAFSETVEIKS